MPNLSSAVLAICKEVLDRPDIVKVKQTDNSHVGLCLFDGGFGIYVDFEARKRSKPVTIGGREVKVKPPKKYAG